MTDSQAGSGKSSSGCLRAVPLDAYAPLSLVSSARATHLGTACSCGFRGDQDGGGELRGPRAAPWLVAASHPVGGPQGITVESTPVVFYFRVPVLTINHDIVRRLLPLYFPGYTLLFSTC